MEQIRLNLIPTGPMPVCHASQYDKKREIGLVLFNGTRPLLLTDETLELDVRKSDSHIVTIDVQTPEGTNLAVFETTEQMCAVAGSNECELRIKKAGADIGSLNFIMEVERSPMENGLQSDSEIRNLATQIAEVATPIVEEIAPPIIRDFLDDLPKPMIYKGTLGTGGTIQTLPAADAEHEGYTYKVITAGTYAEQEAKIGDTFTCCKPEGASDFTWVLFSQGDTDTDTWRNIKVNGTEVIESGISSGAVDFIGSENIEIEYESTGNKIKAKTKNLYTKKEVDDLIEETVYDLLPSETESGPIANFETDLDLPLKSLEIDVNAKQDLHGYDHPWPAGGGDNVMLLSPNNKSGTVFGVTYSYDAETGKITLSGTNNNTTAHGLVGFTPLGDGLITPNFQVGETYTLSAYLPQTTMYCQFTYKDTNNRVRPMGYKRGTGSFSPIAFTVPDDFVELVQFIIYVDGTATTLSGEIYFELVKGSTAPTSFAPYSNICPIEGWSEIKDTRCGSNLWNEEWEEGVYSNTNGSKGNTPNRIRSKGYIPCKPSTSYFYFYGGSIANLWLRICYYDKNFNFISVDNNKLFNRSYTTPSTAFYLTICSLNADITTYSNDISVNYPSSNTAYHAYNGTTEIIELGGTYYGGRLLQDKEGHRRFEVTHKKYVIDGQTPVTDLSYNQTQGNYAQISFLPYIDEGLTGAVFVCNIFEYQSSNVTHSPYKVWSSGSAPRMFFGLPTTITNRNEALAWFTDNPTTIIAPLATPYTIDLPDGEPITTFIGTNNIYADSGDTAVEFKESINQKIASLQALILNT